MKKKTTLNKLFEILNGDDIRNLKVSNDHIAYTHNSTVEEWAGEDVFVFLDEWGIYFEANVCEVDAYETFEILANIPPQTAICLDDSQEFVAIGQYLPVPQSLLDSPVALVDQYFSALNTLAWKTIHTRDGLAAQDPLLNEEDEEDEDPEPTPGSGYNFTALQLEELEPLSEEQKAFFASVFADLRQWTIGFGISNQELSTKEARALAKSQPQNIFSLIDTPALVDIDGVCSLESPLVAGYVNQAVAYYRSSSPFPNEISLGSRVTGIFFECTHCSGEGENCDICEDGEILYELFWDEVGECVFSRDA